MRVVGIVALEHMCRSSIRITLGLGIVKIFHRYDVSWITPCLKPGVLQVTHTGLLADSILCVHGLTVNLGSHGILLLHATSKLGRQDHRSTIRTVQ